MSNKNARKLPPFVPTDEQRERVSILAGNGIPFFIIARCITNPDTGQGIGISTLKHYFRTELKDGRSIADAELIGRAYAMSKTNPAVLIFMLKTRLGWKEPAQEINLRQTYAELVAEATKAKPASPPELSIVNGGKAA